MEAMQVAKQIWALSERIGKMQKRILPLAEDRAATEAAYDIAIKTSVLNHQANGVAVGLIEKIARGDCAEQAMAKRLAELRYSGLMKTFDIDGQRLSALQSLLRRFDEIVS